MAQKNPQENTEPYKCRSVKMPYPNPEKNRPVNRQRRSRDDAAVVYMLQDRIAEDLLEAGKYECLPVMAANVWCGNMYF